MNSYSYFVLPYKDHVVSMVHDGRQKWFSFYDICACLGIKHSFRTLSKYVKEANCVCKSWYDITDGLECNVIVGEAFYHEPHELFVNRAMFVCLCNAYHNFELMDLGTESHATIGQKENVKDQEESASDPIQELLEMLEPLIKLGVCVLEVIDDEKD